MKTQIVRIKNLLSKKFIKYALIPILIIEVSLLVLYFSINFYISQKNVKTLKEFALKDTSELLNYEAQKIDNIFSNITTLSMIMQNEHQRILSNPNMHNIENKPIFKTAPNGVYYKESKNGSSLYYSSKTKITQKEKQKALYTEAMDPLLKDIVEFNDNVVATYFNSYDNMNRLYPYIDKVYEQYGEHINMEDYNFYFLADKNHNPSRKPVWTEAYLDPAGNGWMISCITPIYNENFLEGVSGIDVTVENLVSNVLDIKLHYDAKMFLIDKNGMILAMPSSIEKFFNLEELKKHNYTDVIKETIRKPEEYNIFKNKTLLGEHFRNMLLKHQGVSDIELDDKKYITLKNSIHETQWELMILIDEDNILKHISELKNLSDRIGYAAVSFMIVFYLLFFYFLLKKSRTIADSIALPIEEITKQTTKAVNTNSDIELIDTKIYEIHKLSSNFSKMIVDLRRANRVKDEFMTNMSHEIRTPLNAIMGFTEIVSLNKKPEKNEHYLKMIKDSSNSLLSIVNDIFDFSKMQSGRMEFEIIEFDFKEMMNEIKLSFTKEADRKNIEFDMFFDNDAPTFIKSDPTRVKQVVVNLIENAIKFTLDNGKVDVQISYENKRVCVKVKDNGIGIEKEYMQKIFEPFSQEDASTTRKFGGTGLGLAISNDIAKFLGGELSVDSKVGMGSEFIFCIPAGD
jgi:signal transduction histidine kinase